ncbi:hypothetical protein TWF225_009078 [Orbilia oligospora]|nr:hypothetical protein TWF225_009078 [Orbilia oligospora]KAF3238991.1 hypothetical protein TWF217_001597 [Orbilia oligospora]KAF3246691.1 hypothetical protein TWF128_008809 [Orbilia oligospora]
MGTLSNLPIELKLEIMKNLPQQALGNLSHCSKEFYNLALPLRFKGIILNASAIKVFRDGGLGAEGRYSIRSVCFKRPGDWRSTKNLDELCRSISALKLFPNLKKLSLSYSVPSCMERNVFICLLDGVIACSSRLEDLEINVVEVGSAPGAYQVFYEGLSKVSQDMLGAVIDDKNVWQQSMKKSSQMALPALASVKLFHPSINTPLQNFNSPVCRPRGYYYTIFAMADAPKLRGLAIKTDTHFGELNLSRSNGYISVGLLSKFSRITDLEISQPIAPTDSDTEILTIRFPNLKKLYIYATNSQARELGAIPKGPYASIIRLQRLEYLFLPWPTHPQRGLMSGAFLKSKVRWWAKEGLDLKRVDFEGTRKVEWKDRTEWNRASITFVPSPLGGGIWEAHGSTSAQSHSDLRDDPDLPYDMPMDYDFDMLLESTE